MRFWGRRSESEGVSEEYELLISEVLTVLPADVVSLEWVWNDPQFEEGGVITSTDVASWVWVAAT